MILTPALDPEHEPRPACIRRHRGLPAAAADAPNALAAAQGVFRDAEKVNRLTRDLFVREAQSGASVEAQAAALLRSLRGLEAALKRLAARSPGARP